MTDQKELFTGLGRKLKMTVQDPATSDDPLMAHLQRCGWDLGTVRELQRSISAKRTPDMFSGKTEDLSVREYTLQLHIESFFKVRKGMKEVK